MVRRASLLAAVLAAAAVAAIGFYHRPVAVEGFLNGAVVSYARPLPWTPGGLLVEPRAPGSWGTASIGVTVYGWAPNGSIVKLGEGRGKTLVPAWRLHRYLAEWTLWAAKHGLTARDFEPPVIVLTAATLRNGTVLMDAESATINPQLLLKQGLAATITVPLHGTWRYRPQDYPPKERDINVNHRLVLYSSRIYYDQYLPLAVAYIYGPDKQIMDTVTEHMFLYSQSSGGLQLQFSIMGVGYTTEHGSVEKGGYVVAGPSFLLKGDKQWIELKAYTEFDLSGVRLPSYCRQTLDGPYCLYSANHVKELDVQLYATSRVSYLVSMGIEGDVAKAIYGLEATEDGVHWYPVPGVFVNTTMVRPIIVHNLDTGETFIAGWAEAAPFSMLDEAKAFKPFMNIELNWPSVDLGWHSGAISVSNVELAYDVGTIELLSAGLGLPFGDLDAGLLGVALGAESSSLYINFITIGFQFKRPYRVDGLCKLWLTAHESPTPYTVLDLGSGKQYREAILYVDAYTELGGCQP